MSIIRAPREGNFTIIPNDTLRDTRLSYRARGVLAYVLSHPDNWVTSAQRLADEGTEGRDAMRKALGELETAGYLVRRRYRGDDGRWQTDQVLHDTPQEDLEAPLAPDEGGLRGPVTVTAAGVELFERLAEKSAPGRETSAGSPTLESRSYKKTDQQEQKIVDSSSTAEPASDVSAVGSEEKPKQTTAAALLVAKNWTTPTTQSKAAITLVVAKALAEGFTEDSVAEAVRFLADNDCYASDYSLGQAMHKKVVNGPNAGRKGPLAADRTDVDYGGKEETDPETGISYKSFEL